MWGRAGARATRPGERFPLPRPSRRTATGSGRPSPRGESRGAALCSPPYWSRCLLLRPIESLDPGSREGAHTHLLGQRPVLVEKQPRAVDDGAGGEGLGDHADGIEAAVGAQGAGGLAPRGPGGAPGGQGGGPMLEGGRGRAGGRRPRRAGAGPPHGEGCAHGGLQRLPGCCGGSPGGVGLARGKRELGTGACGGWCLEEGLACGKREGG